MVQSILAVPTSLRSSTTTVQTCQQAQAYVWYDTVQDLALTTWVKREAVFPTRQALGQMNSKLKGAQTGHSLLKRKSEALTKYAVTYLLRPACH